MGCRIRSKQHGYLIRNYAGAVSLAAIVIFCIVSLYCNGSAGDAIDEKTDAALGAFLRSDNAIVYAKAHGIELKDDRLKIVLDVDESLFSYDIASRYGLKDFKYRKNKITAYADIAAIKALCEEPAVIHIRLPAKLRAQ